MCSQGGSPSVQTVCAPFPEIRDEKSRVLPSCTTGLWLEVALMGGIHRKTPAPGRAGSLQGACRDLGVGAGGYLFIYRFLPSHKPQNKAPETSCGRRSRPAQALSTSEGAQQQGQAAGLEAEQPGGAGILPPASFGAGRKGHCACCLFVCPPRCPLPAGMKACGRAFISKHFKPKPPVSPPGCEAGGRSCQEHSYSRSQHPKSPVGSPGR